MIYRKQMHPSRYDIFVTNEGDKTLIYNSFADSFCWLKNEVADSLMTDMVSTIKNGYEKICLKLKEEGFIVEDDINEVEIVENVRMTRRFSPDCYEVFINPTLDCNLGCWYCYESHIKGSRMMPDIVDRILKHLENQYVTAHYRHLSIGFFGGEPLLRPDVVKELVVKTGSFCKEKGITVDYSITTNGTLVTEKLLEVFKDAPVSFQITIDGDKSRHNKIRHYSNSEAGSYERIILSLKTIVSVLTDYYIRVRINYDSSSTFVELPALLDDLDFLPREKFGIDLHKVWQIDEREIDKSSLYDFVNEANERGFSANSTILGYPGCYADNYHQCVINFNGDVYKCTARDFKKENREGCLDETGRIIWDTDKILDRICVKDDQECRECILYPSCPGMCSQSKLEDKTPDHYCRIDKGDLSQILLMKYNNELVALENTKKVKI